MARLPASFTAITVALALFWTVSFGHASTEVAGPLLDTNPEVPQIPDLHELVQKVAKLYFDSIKKRMDRIQEGLPARVRSADPFSESPAVQVLSAPVAATPAQGEAQLAVSLPVESAPAQPEPKSDSQPAKAEAQANQPWFVEAFDPQSTPIYDVNVQWLSWNTKQAFRGEGLQGWVLASSIGHWPTVAWVDEKEQVSVPLISGTDRNAFQMLMTLAALRPASSLSESSGEAGKQSDANGIVFGKLEKGWQILIGGKAERPLYFDSNFQSVDESDINMDRYFVYLNVEAVPQQIFLSGVNAGASLSVSFPVIAHAATYLNLTNFAQITVSGQVFDQQDGEPEVPGLVSQIFQVGIIGQEHANEFTDPNGRFKLKDIYTVGKYPLFAETRDPNQIEFPHRYQVLPGKGRKLKLYRAKGEQLSYWVRKGPGVVSEDSGMVLAYVPSIVADLSDLTLKGKIEAFDPANSTLMGTGQSFTIDAADRPAWDRPLGAHESRFVGFDVHAGANLVELYDEHSQRRMSELVITSPGVVNVIGPY